MSCGTALRTDPPGHPSGGIPGTFAAATSSRSRGSGPGTAAVRAGGRAGTGRTSPRRRAAAASSPATGSVSDGRFGRRECRRSRGTGPADGGLTPLPIASRAYAIGIHQRMRFAFTVCKPRTGSADSKETSGLQRVCKWHSLALQPRGPARGLKCPSGHTKARKRAPAGTCVRCVDPDSEWSPKGARAHHTIAGRNRRCRKGLELLRRLSETTGHDA